MDIVSFITVLVSMLVPSCHASMAVDSILLSNSSMRIPSKGASFELGFFSPGNSGKHYLGIWYNNIPIQTVVWVANRVNPVNDSSAASLTLNSSGSLVLSQSETVVWYSTPLKQVQNPVAELLDSGNLVVRDKEEEANPEAYLWQSFDFPTDTQLPEMKLGCDLKTGLNRRLTAWKSSEDPSPGDISITVALNNYPEFYMMRGDSKIFRTGPWNGMGISGSPELKPNPLFSYTFVSNKTDVYYSYSLKDDSIITRLTMNQTNSVRYRYVWAETDKTWRIYSTIPQDYCDTYGLCGPNGNCYLSNSPVCQCLEGFKPKSPQKWNSIDWSDGCVRKVELKCEDKKKEVGFLKMSGMKLPDTTHTWLDETIGLEECRQKCLNNCSCMAYSNSDIRGQGGGCAMWFGDLIDLRQFSVGEQDLFIRMDASELEVGSPRGKKLIIIVATTIAAISGTLLVGCYFICKLKSKIKEEDQHGEASEDDVDLTFFDLPTIANATDNFSLQNKIGQGGFGTVYKGKLVNGKLIAVKRLSRSSGQGLIEFKNEARLIARLQHRNLVKLLGCCIHGQEKMLVYEYMPNGSLNFFIFDENRGKLLDWPKRFDIICGIARGLMYLHEDSRLRIIYRDIKVGNILLNEKLNPKISDFGMAKTFGGEQTEGNTNRIAGTYGYMAPEYAADGLFSIKSDVFSFGILVMEIIHGKRNRGFYNEDQFHNLLSHAWSLWKEGRALELIDRNIEETCVASETMRCIHVSLLCVQQHPKDRPNMSSVVLMLGSDNELNEPKQPGFFTGKAITHEAIPSSTNEMSLTLLEAR